MKTSGSLLIVTHSEENQVLVEDTREQASRIHSQMVEGVSHVASRISSQIKIRLHPNDSTRAELLSSWESIAPSVTITSRDISFRKAASQSRLVVFGYDSTGFLELITDNFPCLMLLTDDRSFYRDEFARAYDCLMEQKVIFSDSKAMFAHIERIWPNVSDWWREAERQHVISTFQNLACRKPSLLRLDLAKELRRNRR